MGILARSESRHGAQVIWLAVHSTEGNDVPRVDDAAALRDATWWKGSSHAITDNDPGSLITPAEGCVPYDLAAWTLRGGNRYSENIEQVGWARWSRAEWLARPKLLDNTARWLAERSKARGIPLVKLTPADVAARRPGVIGHADYTLGTGDGTHTDPGPNYPWDVVIAKARAYASGTPTPQSQDEEQDMRIISAPKRGIAVIGDGVFGELRTDEEVKTARDWLKLPVHAGNDRQFDVARAIALRMQDASGVLVKLNDLAARMAGIGTADVDEAALAALLAPKLTGITPAQIADALRRVLREGVGNTSA